MSVKVVTDSTSDISSEIANELGIKVVPGYIHIGDKVYRDGIDISATELHDKVAKTKVQPTTSEPTPEDFAKAFSDCSEEAEDILSIHISAKLSRIYESANRAKSIAKGISRIEVLDSGLVSVGLALMVIFAARSAKSGENIEVIMDKTQQVLGQIRVLGLFDTMRGLVFSDRVGAGITALADIANVKPLLTIENGILVRAGMVRTFSEGLEKLYDFIQNDFRNIKDLAISYNMVSDRAEELKKRISTVFSEEKIYVTQLSAALGIHSGPDVLVIATRRSG